VICRWAIVQVVEPGDVVVGDVDAVDAVDVIGSVDDAVDGEDVVLGAVVLTAVVPDGGGLVADPVLQPASSPPRATSATGTSATSAAADRET
jgi:hypothetical protein